MKLKNKEMKNKRFHGGHSLWKNAFYKLKKNRFAMAGLIFLVILSFCCIFAPFLTKYDYASQNLLLGATAPSLKHILGTDTLGRDLFTRVLYGGRISLAVGICATFVSIFIGVIYGAVSGYIGGRVDSLMMSLIDILYALPFTIFVIILMVWLGRNFILIFVAIGAIQWLTMARIVRAEVMSLKKREFIEAARALGLPAWKIIFRHIIPNILGVVIVYATLTIPSVMLIEAFLSFLGLGVQPPMSSWGILIREGSNLMEEFPWLLFFPGVIFAITLFALNFLGDGLRDALDMKMKKK